MRETNLAASNFLIPNATFFVELIAFILILVILARYVLPPVNKALDLIFGLERELVGRVPLPFGVSLVAVLRRPR